MIYTFCVRAKFFDNYFCFFLLMDYQQAVKQHVITFIDYLIDRKVFKTKVEIAKELGISTEKFRNFYHEPKRKISVDLLIRFLKSTDVNPMFLLFGEEPMIKPKDESGVSLLSPSEVLKILKERSAYKTEIHNLKSELYELKGVKEMASLYNEEIPSKFLTPVIIEDFKKNGIHHGRLIANIAIVKTKNKDWKKLHEFQEEYIDPDIPENLFNIRRLTWQQLIKAQNILEVNLDQVCQPFKDWKTLNPPLANKKR